MFILFLDILNTLFISTFFIAPYLSFSLNVLSTIVTRKMFTFFKKYTKITEAEKIPAYKNNGDFSGKRAKSRKNSLGKSDSSHPAAQNGAAIKYLYNNAGTGRSDPVLENCRNFVPARV